MKKLLLLFISTVTALFSYAQPTADFSFTTDCQQQMVTFTDLSTCNGCTIANWNWDFGDANTSSQQNPVHIYPVTGTYNVTLTVIDNNSVTHSVTYPVTINSVTVTISQVNSPSTCGACDGSITATATGGDLPYTYAWSSGEITPTVTNSCAGVYTITVTDINGCTGITTATLTDTGSTITVTFNTNDPTSCGACDGSINPTVSGGNPPYSYLWSPGGETANPINGLCAGVYTVFITDASGCSDTESVTLISPNSPVITLDSVSTLGCGNDEAYIGVSVTGGSGGYTYEWSRNGAVFSTLPPPLTNAIAGIYTLAVTDDLLCSSWLDIVITDSCGAATGRVFNDLNGNGIDDGEPGIPGVVIQTTNGFSTGVSNPFGYYYVNLPDTGSFEITPLNFPYYYTMCSNYYLTDGEITVPLDSTLTVQISSGNLVSSGNDFGFMNPDTFCGSISGHVFNDLNQNGVEDVGEMGYNAVNVRITNSGGQSIITNTNNSGDYSASVPFDDTYTVEVILNNTSYYCNYSESTGQTFPLNNQDYTVTLTTGSPTSTGNDFGIYYYAGFDAGVYNISAYQGVNAGRMFHVGMDYKIYGTLTGTCTLRLDFDPLITFVSSSITPDVIGSNYLEWIYDGSFVNTPFWNCMALYFMLDSSAVAGQQLVWTGSFSCTDNDACPANDTLIRTYTVQSGPLKTESTFLGPNSKEVLHTGNQTTGDITHADSTFSYIINFQNLTLDTVCNVIVIDQLSPYLDVTTLSQAFSPHTQHIHEQYMPNPQTVVWVFDDLILTDTASNYMESYGFVQYNIRMKPNLPIGTVIENRAWIIFNYGDSIPTNIVSNTIVNTDSYPENTINSEINIYPNPANTSVIIESKSAKGIYQLQDVTGKVLLSGNVTAAKFSIDISTLSKGIYLLSLIDGEQQVNRKVVKE